MLIIKRANMDWLQPILKNEENAHCNFYGRKFDLSKFEKTLKKYGERKIQKWKKLSLETHYPFPSVMTASEIVYAPGCHIRPRDWFLRCICRGEVLRDINGELKVAQALENDVVLIDVRLKPNYNSGKQMWENDILLGGIIEKLRKKGKIIGEYEYGPQSSRFGIHIDTWEKIGLVLAKKLKLEKIRLERVLEAVTISQMYPHMPRKDDGITDTWCWYEEYLEVEDRNQRLYGGNSDDGGLASVCYSSAVYHSPRRSARFLAVL